MRSAGWVALGMVVAGCARTRDPGDLRAEALLILQAAETSDTGLTLAEVLGPEVGPVAVPPVVRVWRRGLDGSADSCSGRVDVLDLETYVAGVLPSEWMAAWPDASLDAGAIAARTYAAFWVAAGGRYTCADVDDTTWTQVYRDERHPRTDEAVSRTAGAVAVRADILVYAEYSAENGPVTEHGVEDRVCAGRRVDGHGRGMCQWGTQRWAIAGQDAAWMVAHYYPGARVAWADEALVDGVELTVRAGERFTLELSATNPGPEAWPAGALSVGTDDATFADEGWPADDRPAVHDAPVAPAETVVVTWTMRAPDVTVATTYPEYFWLDGPAADRPGSAGSWRITVLPAEPAAVAPPEERAWWPFLCVAAAGLVVGGVIGRGRRRSLRAGAVGGLVIRRRR